MFNSTIKSTIEGTLKASGLKFSALQKSPRTIGKVHNHHLCWKTPSTPESTEKIVACLELLESQGIVGWTKFSSRDGSTTGIFKICPDDQNALIK